MKLAGVGTCLQAARCCSAGRSCVTAMRRGSETKQETKQNWADSPHKWILFEKDQSQIGKLSQLYCLPKCILLKLPGT